MDIGPKKPFKLTRRNALPPSPPQEIIQKNLEPLIINKEKKNYAQEVYYKNNPEGTSLLLKEEKGPVRQRLGLKEKSRRSNLPWGTNTTHMGPKYKILRHGKDSMKKKKYSAQDRLIRIRQSQKMLLSNMNNKHITLRRHISNTQNIPFEYKFKLHLDPHVKHEIQTIQSSCNSIPLNMEDFIFAAECTYMKINDRFSSY